MGKEEEVELERKSYESDSVWAARKTFLLTHWDDYPREQLECYSQLFININMIGCVYNPGVMEKINEMGKGIMEKANRLKNERQFVYASRGRAEANEVRKREEEEREAEKKARAQDNGLMERIRQLRNHMVQAMCASPMGLMNMCDRVQLRWYIERCVDGHTVLRIRQLTVFKYKFSHIVEPKDEVLRAVTDSFINCEPSISGDEMLFNDVNPDECYRASLQRRMIKSARFLTANDGFNSLNVALSNMGLKVEQKAQQLQGWSQQMEIRAGELLIASKVLTKSECVKAKMVAAVDEMCRPICEVMRRGTLKIISTTDGLTISCE